MKSLRLLFLMGFLALRSGYAGDADSDINTANLRLEALSKQLSEAIYQITESPRQKQLFEQSQRAWVQFRDAQANFDASRISAGDANFKTEYLRCLTKMTNDRIKYLESLLEPISKNNKTTP